MFKSKTNPSNPGVYQRKRPENTVLYRVAQENLETYLAQKSDYGYSDDVAKFVEHDFRKYLTCGILAHGFARVRCACGKGFVVGLSCKTRGVCPSCNTRSMVEIAAHLVDNVLPRLAERQVPVVLSIIVRPCKEMV